MFVCMLCVAVQVTAVIDTVFGIVTEYDAKRIQDMRNRPVVPFGVLSLALSLLRNFFFLLLLIARNLSHRI